MEKGAIMGVLSKQELEGHIERGELFVTPLLSRDQIGPASIDIRLGSSIIIPKKTYVEKQDVTDREKIRQVERRLYDRVRLKYHSKFMLHPNQLILGVTLEYLSLPVNLSCAIMSRSSWGRLGLVVATAAMVQPAYKGCLTLELVNLSESPIALYPGLPIGQLVFHDTPEGGKTVPYQGRYKCSTEAEAPKFFIDDTDKEMAFWGDTETKNEDKTQT
jgi:dCTP deaminase